MSQEASSKGYRDVCPELDLICHAVCVTFQPLPTALALKVVIVLAEGVCLGAWKDTGCVVQVGVLDWFHGYQSLVVVDEVFSVYTLIQVSLLAVGTLDALVGVRLELCPVNRDWCAKYVATASSLCCHAVTTLV
jgi:hypothetical protein